MCFLWDLWVSKTCSDDDVTWCEHYDEPFLFCFITSQWNLAPEIIKINQNEIKINKGINKEKNGKNFLKYVPYLKCYFFHPQTRKKKRKNLRNLNSMSIDKVTTHFPPKHFSIRYNVKLKRFPPGAGYAVLLKEQSFVLNYMTENCSRRLSCSSLRECGFYLALYRCLALKPFAWASIE